MTYEIVEVLPRPFRPERAVSPADDSPMWVVVDADFELQPDAAAFLASLRGQEDASVNTERTYAGRIALYLSYCADRGIDWAAPSIGQLSVFLSWLVNEPWSSPLRHAPARQRFRTKGTANAITGTIFRFLRFCSLLDDSPVSSDVAARLYEPRQLLFAPPGYDRGEDGQFSVVNVKTIKFKVAVPGYEYLTDDEIRKILDLTTRARDRLLVALMAVTGCRIGEALGLRREDMHLLSSSKVLGCPVEGPHIHIRRRQNANGALAKTRKPRWIPVGEDIGGLYADYQWESKKMKREAVDTLRVLAIDRSGAPAPIGSATAYEMRSVAVPWGTAPSRRT